MDNSKYCFIFFYESYIEVSPSILNISLHLKKNGYKVTVFINENDYELSPQIHEFITVVTIRNNEKSLKAYWQGCVEYLLNKAYSNRNMLSVAIGVDNYGAIISNWISKLLEINFYVLSLELPFDYLKNKYYYRIERKAYLDSQGIIVQDNDRLNVLQNYYDCEFRNIIFFPNSPLISDNLIDSNSNYFYEKLNINKKKYPYIALVAGMICDEVCSVELASVFSRINSEFALVFHERFKRDENEPFINEVKSLNSTNLFLSLQPISFFEIDRIYLSATIGIVTYRDVNKNFSIISKASGKLGYFLKLGKPLICNNLPSLKSLIAKYDCGIIIDNIVDEIEWMRALTTITNNYNHYSQNALKCYETEFCVELFLPQIEKELAKNLLPALINETTVFSVVSDFLNIIDDLVEENSPLNRSQLEVMIERWSWRKVDSFLWLKDANGNVDWSKGIESSLHSIGTTESEFEVEFKFFGHISTRSTQVLWSPFLQVYGACRLEIIEFYNSFDVQGRKAGTQNGTCIYDAKTGLVLKKSEVPSEKPEELGRITHNGLDIGDGWVEFVRLNPLYTIPLPLGTTRICLKGYWKRWEPWEMGSRVEQLLGDKNEQLKKLENSPQYRIGKTLLWPLRWMLK